MLLGVCVPAVKYEYTKRNKDGRFEAYMFDPIPLLIQ
jgi:hypothetical protein